MNATQLFHQDGRSAGIYYCQTCRIVHREEALAEQCCAPYKCQDCACEIDRKNYRTVCSGCSEAREQKREAERFEKAEKVNSWDGWIFVEGMGYNEGYFNDVGDLMDWLADQQPDEEELAGLNEEERAEIPKLPAYAWCCVSNKFAQLSINSVLEITESADSYEDFDSRDLAGIPDLEKAIDAFNEANSEVVSWVPDYKRALLLSDSNGPALPPGWAEVSKTNVEGANDD